MLLHPILRQIPRHDLRRATVPPPLMLMLPMFVCRLLHSEFSLQLEHLLDELVLREVLELFLCFGSRRVRCRKREVSVVGNLVAEHALEDRAAAVFEAEDCVLGLALACWTGKVGSFCRYDEGAGR